MNFLKIIKNFPIKASKYEVKNLRRLYCSTTELPNKGKTMPNEPILPRNWYKDKLYENYKTDFLTSNSKNYNSIYSNIDNKNKNFIKIDLEKKTNHKKKYDNIIIFNVLEHLSDINLPLKNLNFLLKKKSRIFGSTPFIYRTHGAPSDYNRFTKDYLKIALKKKKIY